MPSQTTEQDTLDKEEDLEVTTDAELLTELTLEDVERWVTSGNERQIEILRKMARCLQVGDQKQNALLALITKIEKRFDAVDRAMKENGDLASITNMVVQDTSHLVRKIPEVLRNTEICIVKADANLAATRKVGALTQTSLEMLAMLREPVPRQPDNVITLRPKLEPPIPKSSRVSGKVFATGAAAALLTLFATGAFSETNPQPMASTPPNCTYDVPAGLPKTDPESGKRIFTCDGKPALLLSEDPDGNVKYVDYHRHPPAHSTKS